MLSKGAIATYGIDYYELGKIVASQASKILKGEEKIENIPIEHIRNAKLNLNYDIAEKLGIDVTNNLKGES